jgi:uncharacterized protein (TIGR02001 family)
VVHSHPAKLTPARWLLTWTLLTVAAPHAAATALGTELAWGGNLAVTSDYIYRGVSESNGRAALQADLHADTPEGTFAGAWASTRDHGLDPGAGYDFEIYLGRRIELASAWNATVSARSHYFLGGGQESSNDYQEISGALTWLDRWTMSLSVIPNAVRYWYYRRLSRSPAWIADTTGQWLIGEGLFVTGGAGYYRSTGTGAGQQAATGYAYGNVGLAFERRRWRLDIGYFIAKNQARELSPYPVASHRVAGTVSWHF